MPYSVIISHEQFENSQQFLVKFSKNSIDNDIETRFPVVGVQVTLIFILHSMFYDKLLIFLVKIFLSKNIQYTTSFLAAVLWSTIQIT